MKNIYRFYAIILCVVFSVSAWGATDTAKEYSASNLNGWTGNGSGLYSDGSLKLDATGEAQYKTNIWSGEVSTGMTSISVTINYKVNGTASSNNVFTIYALNSSGASQASATFTPTSTSYTNVSRTLTIPSNSAVTGLKIEYTTKVGGNVAIKSLSATATYTPAASCTNTPTMSFSTPTTINKTTADNTFTKTVTITGKGSGQTVSYSSSDETIATVNNSGVVTLKGKVGTTTITASVEANGSYCSASASYTLNVTLAPIDVTLHYKGTTAALSNQTNPYTLPTTGTYVADACDAWVFDGWYGSSYAKNTSKPTYITQLTSTGSAYAVYKHTEGGGSGTIETYTASGEHDNGDTSPSASVGDVSISFTQNGGQNAPKYYSSGTSVRMYADNKLTVSSSGENITAISFTFGGTTSAGLDANVGSYSAGSWTGNAASVEFEAGSSGQQHIQAMTITLGGGGTTYYSTDAECGPKVQATASPWVTSTQGATVKIEVPVTATNFDKNSTLIASVSGTGFSFVGWGANGNSVTAGEDLTTSLILVYNPTVFSSDATITFNSTYSGSQTPVYTPGTVHGRSLPGLFVIAIKNDGTWYALPANMDGSGTYAGVAVDVDDIDNPTKVTAGPATALYRLTGVHPSRYDDYGTRVRFMSEYNSKCLWSNTATGGTGINNGALLNNANSDNYEWTLVTTDGVNYAINTNVAKKIEEGRELRYYAGESRFGMYTSGNSSFRLLPVDCYTRATVSDVSTTYNSVTLTWAGKSGTNYNVYIDEGGVTKKTETNVTSPVTISGLSSETNYTWIISPGAKDNGCALSGNFTTNVAPINVTLSCDGTEYHLGPQDKPYTLPTSGVYVANACTEWTFEGWTANTHSKSTSKPTMIDQVSTDGTVYAVYKNTEGGSNSGSLTITEVQTGGSSYNTSYSVTEYTSESDAITIASNNILNNVDYIQLKAGAGNRIYNTTAMPGAITQITVTATTNSAYVYVGSSSVGSGSTALEPTSGSRSGTAVYTIPAGNTYFAVGATSDYVKVSNIEVLYSSSTSYYATSSECCNEVAVPTVVVVPVDVSATISWDNQSGATNGYRITCSNGTDQDVAAGVTSLVISGLSASTSYDYTVTAKGATCNRTFEGSFTTASCSDVPTDVTVSAGTHTATIRWTASASTATVVIYDDDLGTSTVQSVENQTSPCTISGLNDNTDYYVQVFAGGGCPHPIKPFRTQATAVSIAEWFPDSIRINLNSETTASVIIEDKKEHGSSSSSKVADKLFFAKYFEGEGSMKLISIYNGTDHDISLSGYKINVITRSYNKTKKEWNTSDSEYDLSSLGTIFKGQEIIFFSRPLSSEAVYSCADTWLTEQAAKNGSEDNPRWIECESGGTYITKAFTFNGNDALQLIDGSTVIDCFGAANKTIYPAELNCRNEECWKAKVRNMDYGKAASDFPQEVQDNMDLYGIDLVHDSIAELATARVILFRDLSVVNGDDAVANNTSTFATFASEWNGRDICGSGTTGLGTCNSFKDLGLFDYNDYYASYEAITPEIVLNGHPNDDGTFTIPIESLDTLACTMLRVKVYEGTEEKASTEYKVPIMVEGAHSTKDTIFICDYPTQTRTAVTCKDCDVVILKGGVLTKASSGETGDNAEVRDLTIYPGGTLIVPEGPQYEYTVNSILFRVEKETAPVAKLKGDLITKTEQVIVTRRIKNDRYYFFSLPYDCNIADICWPNGEKPVRGVDYEIVEYDGERRANEGSTQGAPGHWKPVEGTQLKAGVGYNVAVASDILKELVFPMAIGQTNLTDKEDNKTSNKVTIHQYTNTGTTINNHNWNLVAHPYVSAFSAYTGDKITAGYLEYTEPANPGEAGSWDRSETDKVYLTMPSFNSGGITYTQTVSSGISSLNPFLAVFVQGAGEGDMTFEQSARKLSAPARHLAAQAEDEDESIFAGVTLSGNGESDQTNLRIRPDFTDEYQLGYDLEKFITFYTPRPQVYMKTPAYRLAFQAVSDDVAKNTFLPMGVYCYQAGTYTFALYDRYPIDELEAVYLFDKQTGITTNLLYDSYSFTTTGQIYTNTRFSLNVIVKRRTTETPTDVENLEAPDSMVRKILINGHVYIQRGGAIYDVTGKQMLNH